MNSDPVRLFDDAEAGAGLRDDLLHAAQAQVQGLDHEAGLAQLHQATRATAGSAAAGVSSRVKIGVGVAAVVAVALWLGMRDPAAVPEPAAGPATVGSVADDVHGARAVARAEVANARPEVPAAVPGAEIDPEDDPSTPEAGASPEPAAVSPEAEASPTPEVEASPTPEAVNPPHESSAAEPAPRRRTAKPQPAEAEPSAPSVDAVLDEARLVARARASLAGDPQRSLSLTEQAEREFPQGQLVEERRAIAIRALVALGRHDEARRRGDAFLAKFSKGAHARSVRRALDGEP